MKNEMKKKNNKGFSLVELIVVIAIMAVLMVVLAPAMLRYVEKTRAQKDASAVSEVIEAVNAALADEKINDAVSTSTTVVCANGSITTTNDPVPTGSTATEGPLLTEIHNTIADADFNLTSKTYSSRTYTIHITTGPDGVSLKAEAYADTNWSGSGSGSTT